MMQMRTISRRTPQFPHLGAFESTKLMGSSTDILGTTRHIERWKEDLQLLHSASLMQLRYSVPWHRIEQTRGTYDFSWLDGPMAYMESNGMTPILDPLHHISFPDWLDQGFANPEFPELYEQFVLEVARRYPWVNHYTVFNEPLPTTLFCSYTGLWYPHYKSDRCFVSMAMNVARAICRVSASLRKFNPQVQLVHVDTCETHRARDSKSRQSAGFAQARRFLMHDMILGRVQKSHELYSYLLHHGFTDDD